VLPKKYPCKPDIFEATYDDADGETESTQKTGLNFGQALDALKKGDCISRKGWNGKNMHVSMLSLYTADNVPIDNKCLVLFNVNCKYNTWVPSITDLLADDWEVVNQQHTNSL